MTQGIHFARQKSDLTNGFLVWPYAAFQLYRFNRSAWYKVCYCSTACTAYNLAKLQFLRCLHHICTCPYTCCRST